MIENRAARGVVYGLMLTWANAGAAESLDPCYPEQWHARRTADVETLSWWPPARIRQLEAEQNQLRRKISKLPQHRPRPLPDRLGYHSLAGSSGSVSGSHQVVVRLSFSPELGSIALAPAFNPLDPDGGVYAFPQRFKIEVLETTGRWERGTGETEEERWVTEAVEWVEVVNWMEEDFPDPGPYPVFFSGINRHVSEVRLTVPGPVSKSDDTHFALGELYLFKNQEGVIGDNMAAWVPKSVAIEASDSLAIPPLWDVSYLYDGVTGLGVPLSEETLPVKDLMVTFGNDNFGEADQQGDVDQLSEQSVRFVLDLGQTKQVGRIEIWPAEAPHGMAVPLFGFPGTVAVELSDDPNFQAAKTFEIRDTRSQMLPDKLLTVITGAHRVRYVRLTLEQLREYLGNPILAIGEITVSEDGLALSEGCSVSAEGIPEADLDQLPRLVDGVSRQRRILPEQQWILGLAKRRPLDRRLAVVRRELVQAREAWGVLQLRLSAGGGTVLLLTLVSAWMIQKRQRGRELNKLKSRITRDLHDEVGSSLGSISLTSEQLEEMAPDGELKEELGELSLMAREACASLREVVWMTDQKTIRLPALIGKLIERADRVLRGVELTTQTSPDCPDVEVSLPLKRHLIMFFKEAVHNCARHAGATKVQLSVDVGNDFLRVSIADNGCGFDPATESDGWGLRSMNKRSEELGGELQLTSRAGKGTTVELTVPLSILSGEPSSGYKTSNE